MTTTPRGGGREAMIVATIDTLREGREVRVLEIAEAAGVSHSLIYRHFPDGGREELIAEAYARIYRTTVDEDLAALRQIEGTPEDFLAQVRELMLVVLSPARVPVRWGRLEALAAARTNPHLARRIESARTDMVEGLTDLLCSRWVVGRDRAEVRAFAILTLSLPLGLTAMLPVDVEAQESGVVADEWSRLVTSWLAGWPANVPHQGAVYTSNDDTANVTGVVSASTSSP